MSTSQSAATPVATLPADFVTLVGEALTGRSSLSSEAQHANTPAVQYTVCEEDDGYYD